MAADREAARRARLRGAGRDIAADADTSFGFGPLPAATTTTTDTETTTALQTVSQNAPQTVPTPRRSRTGIGGVKRASPGPSSEDRAEDAIKRTRSGRADPYDFAEAPEPAQRQGGPLEGISNTASVPAPVRNDTRAQERAGRLRGAQTRTPGPVNFGFELPAVAPVPAPVLAVPPPGAAAPPASGTPPTQRQTAAPVSINPGARTHSSPPPTSTQRTRDAVTPEFQIIEGSTIRESTGRGSQGSRGSRRASRQASMQEVTESPRDRPGSGRRVTRSSPMGTRAAGREAAMIERAAEKLRGVVAGGDGSPRRRERATPPKVYIPSEISPTLTVKDGDVGNVTPRRVRKEDEMDIDELSPDHSRRQNNERDGKSDSVMESMELSSPSHQGTATPIPDDLAANELQRRRAAKGKAVDYTDRSALEGEESEDEFQESDVDLDSITATQRRQKKKPGRPRKDKGSPAAQRAGKNKTAARAAASSGPLPVLTKKRGRPPGSKNSAPSKRRAQNMGPRSKETIAIQTYRLNSPAPGITDHPEDLDELSNPILSAPIPQPGRERKSGGVNGVDVLRQILNEVLQSALESLERGASQADDAARRNATEEKVEERREYRNKLRAVEAWGEVLDSELSMMGLNLDAGWGLSRRVKDKEIQRQELRQRLLEVRAERERVGVRADAVRTRHEVEGAEAERRRRINSGLVDLETVVALAQERGVGEGEVVEESTGEKLEMVGALASSRHAGGGLLKRLREFNGFLERAALALEGR